MAVDIAAVLRNFNSCSKSGDKLRKHWSRLKLILAIRQLESVAIDILKPLPHTKSGKCLLLDITDRFTKLTQVVGLGKQAARFVALAFLEVWDFKYKTPLFVLLDYVPQFAAMFFKSVCRSLGITNVYTNNSHPQTNGQVKCYNGTVMTRFRNYDNEQQNDWDVYASALTYAYENQIQKSTKTKPFKLVLSHPPSDFTLHLDVAYRPAMTR